MENSIGYVFKNKDLLKKAFTHVSYANEFGLESNQRLEFLGDSVLSFIVAKRVYMNFPEHDEGNLTKIRSNIVCEEYLATVAKKLNLSEFLKKGKSEIHGSKSDKPSILADTLEALLGAIFLDGGIEAAEKWIDENIEMQEKSEIVIDYKSKLQIYFQKKYKSTNILEYKTISQKGEAHEPIFLVEVLADGKVIGNGAGKSIKRAEQEAAKEACDNLFENFD